MNINSLSDALKAGKIIEVDLDVYLTESNRVLKYDRYFKTSRRSRGRAMWVDDQGNVFFNFSDAYHCSRAYRWA